MRIKDLIIIILGCLLTPFVLLVVGIIELKRKWNKKEK